MSRPALFVVVLLLLTPACSSPVSPSVPNVQGFWAGSWVATTCTTNFPVSCESILQNGPLYLRLTQSGQSVQGFLSVCGAEADQMAGTVAANGMLTFAGRGSALFPDSITASLASTVSGTVMTGSFVCTLNVDTSGHKIDMTGTLKNVTVVSRDPNAQF